MKPQTEYRITQICGAYWFYHQLTPECFTPNLDLRSKHEVFRYIAKRFLAPMPEFRHPVSFLTDQDKRLTCECGYRVALVAVIEASAVNQIHFLILKNAVSWNQRFVQNIIFIQAAAYLDLQNYEMGLQAMLIDPDKCSLLIGEPNLNTLRKILNVEE